MHDAGFLLISLRPVGGHAGLRRAVARRGGRLLALPPWRLQAATGAAATDALDAALACPTVLFTSPAAVRAAATLRPLASPPGRAVHAIGEGTRRALIAAGVADARAPARMDSEGLLALPAFAALADGDALGLVTAPGGRGEIARQLIARGVRIVRADVYARVPVPLRPAALHALQQALDDAASPVVLAVSSGEAFERVLAALPPPLQSALRNATVVAASDRLAGLARSRGFDRVLTARSARPADLVAAVP